MAEASSKRSTPSGAAGRRIFGLTGLLAGLIAIALSYVWSQPEVQQVVFYDRYPRRPDPSPLTQSDIESYKRDGFIILRNYVRDKQQLDVLVQEAERIFGSWNFLDVIFRSAYAKLSMQVWRFSYPFARLAFESSLPSISAQLFSTTGSTTSNKNEEASDTTTRRTTTVRLLKDAIFGYTTTGKGCGFHLDDKGFWPANDASAGVQYWLALSPYRISQGGGVRVANASLTAPFADECLSVIRSGGGSTTCRIEELSPSCHKKMMDASIMYDMEPGDLLVWDRHTWHRSEPFRVERSAHKLRYTVRYIPQNAIAEGMLHPSVESGKPFNSPYYPQVWPEALESEVDVIRQGMEGDLALLPIAKRMLTRALGLGGDSSKDRTE